MCNQQRLRPACAYAQSDQSLCKSLEYSMNVQLLAEHHLVFLSLNGGCIVWSESILVNMPLFWKSHVTAHFYIISVAICSVSGYTRTSGHGFLCFKCICTACHHKVQKISTTNNTNVLRLAWIRFGEFSLLTLQRYS